MPYITLASFAARLESFPRFSRSSLGFGVLRSPYGAHRNRSCWDDLREGPACRCSNFFGGNCVAAPDIAQNPAAPPRSLFARYPSLRTPAALRRRPRHARRCFRAARLVVVIVYAHAPAPRRTRTKLPGEKRQTAHEIWARRSGHFSMPATALHRSESYLSRPVAPFNAAGRAL